MSQTLAKAHRIPRSRIPSRITIGRLLQLFPEQLWQRINESCPQTAVVDAAYWLYSGEPDTAIAALNRTFHAKYPTSEGQISFDSIDWSEFPPEKLIIARQIPYRDATRAIITPNRHLLFRVLVNSGAPKRRISSYDVLRLLEKCKPRGPRFSLPTLYNVFASTEHSGPSLI